MVAELTRHALLDANLPVDEVADLCVAFCLKVSVVDLRATRLTAGVRRAEAHPSFVSPLRIWRMACWMRFSFSTSANRT